MTNIRDITEAESAAWADAKRAGFFDPHHTRDGDMPAYCALGPWRRTAAFAGAGIAATTEAISMRMSVPGGALIPTCGITSVAVVPDRRSSGLLSAMMAHQLRAAHDRGELMAALVSSQWPLYGRYGFGPAVWKTGIEADATGLATVRELPGDIELVAPDVAAAAAPAVYERSIARRAGGAQRPFEYWQGRNQPAAGADRDERFHLLCLDRSGTVVGYAAYRAAESWSRAERPQYTASVSELIADNPLYEAKLWQFIASHDFVTRITAGGQPVDAIWPLLLRDARAVHQTFHLDALWVRPLNPEAILTARRYENPGTVILRIVDPLGYADATLFLDGGPEGADCHRTSNAPDVTMPAASLASLLLGGQSAVRLAAVGAVEEHRPGAAARADAMFRTAAAPWRSTAF